MRRLLPCLLLSILITSTCSLPLPGLHLPESPTPSPTPTSTITPGYTNCGWNWATQNLPELSAEIQAAMEAAGLTGVTARAEAYGENCFDPQTSEVRYFATRETDFKISIKVESLEDRPRLGELAEQVLIVLDSFPPGAMPGSNPGYVGIRFLVGSEELNLWFTVTDGEAARATRQHGAELLDELVNR